MKATPPNKRPNLLGYREHDDSERDRSIYVDRFLCDAVFGATPPIRTIATFEREADQLAGEVLDGCIGYCLRTFLAANMYDDTHGIGHADESVRSRMNLRSVLDLSPNAVHLSQDTTS